MINRWVILGVSVFVSVLVFSLYVSVGVWLVLAVVSFLSVLCFLGVFALGYVSTDYRAGMNPYVRKVGNMDWFGNPMYLAWLFENNRRKFYKYCTIVSAPFGFVFGFLLSFFALYGWTTIAQSDLALGSLGSLGLTVFVASCWYEGICKPHTELVENDTSEMELDDSEKEEALKYD